MAAAATVAVDVPTAGLSIALVLIAVHFAAIFASVGWHFVRSLVRGDSREDVVAATHLFFFSIHAVVYDRGDSTRAEGSFDEVVAYFLAVTSHLTAARAGAVVVLLASHALASVGLAVSTARFALVCGDSLALARHMSFPLADGPLGL
jgi:hypothetical protein